MSHSNSESNCKYTSLVLAGGGIRSLAHVGAIARLEENGSLENVTNFAGASAGAGIATLLAAGYTSKELLAFMISFDFKHLIVHNPIKEGINIIRKFGLYSNSKLLSEFKRGLSAKHDVNITFKQLQQATGNSLIMTTTNLTKGRIEVLSPDTTPDICVCDGLTLTTDLPLYFGAQRFTLPGQQEECTFTDGGVLCNLPNIFVPQPSVSLNLISSTNLSRPTDNLNNYLYTLLETMSDKIDSLSNNIGRVINIDTGKIGATDFDISLKQKLHLIRAGFESVPTVNGEKTMYPSWWGEISSQLPRGVDTNNHRYTNCNMM